MPRESTRGDDAWYAASYEEIIANSSIQARALAYAETMRANGDPEISMSDVQASRAYLRACIFNMSVSEVSAKKPDELAALWGRGALGAAKYRVQGARPKVRRKRKRVSADDD